MALTVGTLLLAACRVEGTSIFPFLSPAAGLTAADLPAIVVAEADILAGLAPDVVENGPAELEAILLPEGVVAPVEVSSGFVAGYQSAFVGRPDGDDRGQVRMASAVLLFDADDTAQGALELLALSSGALDRLDRIGAAQVSLTGLGDEVYARSLHSDAADIHTFVWRNGSVVVVVSAGGDLGAIERPQALALARAVDDRIPV